MDEGLLTLLLEREPDPALVLTLDGEVIAANRAGAATWPASGAQGLVAGAELRLGERAWRAEGLGDRHLFVRCVDRPGSRLSAQECAHLLSEAQVGLSIVRVPDPSDPESMRIEFNNRAASEASGADVSGAIGQLFLEAFPMVRDTPFPGLYQRIARDGVRIDLPEIRYGDELVPSAVFQVSLDPGPGGLVIGQYTNVTAARRAQLRFRRLFDVAPVALVQVELEGLKGGGHAAERLARCVVLDLNRQAAALLASSSVAPERDLLGHVLGDTEAGQAEAFLEAVDAGCEHWEGPMRIRSRDGQDRDVWLTFHQLPGRQPQGILGFTDITEVRALQRELERSNRDLKEFARTVAHDLRSPVQAVQALTELAGLEKLGPKASRSVDGIGRSARRMQDMIADLLRYAEVGHAPPQLVPHDPRQSLAEALEDLDHHIQAEQAHVEVGELPAVLAHPGYLARVFQNLIGNAVKYRGDERPVVQVSGYEADGRVYLEVRDNGRGFSSEQAVGIFEPFHRLSPDVAPGSGLGLATVRRILDLHGGDVSVSSEPGVGTCFTLELKAAAQVLQNGA